MSGENFCLERHGLIFVIIPQCDLGSLAELDMESELTNLVESFETSGLKHVLVDFQHVPYFGSTTISLLIKFAKLSRARGGRMALCNLSATASEVLRVMKLEAIWPQYTSRQDGLDALSGSPVEKFA